MKRFLIGLLFLFPTVVMADQVCVNDVAITGEHVAKVQTKLNEVVAIYKTELLEQRAQKIREVFLRNPDIRPILEQAIQGQ